MAHGTCPQVGIGGHATIGGLGPSSRMWGAALDHIEEIEVVLADSSIVRASATQNQDVFWAVKGAGASFGIVTEFVCRTEPEPGEAVQYSYSFTVGSYASFAATFKTWQKFVSDPGLTRRFASEVVITEIGMIISGTFFGSREEYDALNMEKRFPGNQDAKTVVFKDWVGLVAHWGEEMALRLGGGLAAPLYTKSLTFNGADLIPDSVVDQVFGYLDKVEKDTLIWFIIFDLAGGAINDVAQDATSYAHRDALFYLQSYAVGVGQVSDKTKAFLRGVNTTIKNGMPGGQDFGAYAGYVDPELVNGPAEYWRTNLPRLQQIKSEVDTKDVFHNPQSVPLAGTPVPTVPPVIPKRGTTSLRISKLC
jgi:FAD/FMN-containing dehydrogenase